MPMTREVVKPVGSQPTGADGRCRRTVLGHAQSRIESATADAPERRMATSSGARCSDGQRALAPPLRRRSKMARHCARRDRASDHRFGRSPRQPPLSASVRAGVGTVLRATAAVQIGARSGEVDRAEMPSCDDADTILSAAGRSFTGDDRWRAAGRDTPSSLPLDCRTMRASYNPVHLGGAGQIRLPARA